MHLVLVKLGFSALWLYPNISSHSGNMGQNLFGGLEGISSDFCNSNGLSYCQVGPYSQPLSFPGGVELLRVKVPGHIVKTNCLEDFKWNHSSICNLVSERQ